MSLDTCNDRFSAESSARVCLNRLSCKKKEDGTEKNSLVMLNGGCGSDDVSSRLHLRFDPTSQAIDIGTSPLSISDNPAMYMTIQNQKGIYAL